MNDDKTFARPSAVPSTPYDYEQGENEGDESYRLRIVGRAAQLERDLASKTRDADHFYQLSGRYLEELNAAKAPSAGAATSGRCDHLPDIIRRARAINAGRMRGDAFGKFPPNEALDLAEALVILADREASGQPVTAEQKPPVDPDTGALRDDLEAVAVRLYERLFKEVKQRFDVVLPGHAITDRVLEVLERWASDALKQPVVAEQMPLATKIEEALWALHSYESSRGDGGRCYSEQDIAEMVAAVRVPSASTAVAAPSPLTQWLKDNAPDCGDNSCLFGGRGKGGMRTNGGCRCYKDLPTAKRIYVERLFAAFNAPSATERTLIERCRPAVAH